MFGGKKQEFLRRTERVLQALNLNATVEVQKTFMHEPIIWVDIPPEQLVLPEGAELRGPDVGNRYLRWEGMECIVTDTPKKQL